MAVPHAPIEDLLRPLAPQVLGALVRRYGRLDAAEDAVQEALLAAATQWPVDGLPTNPLAWLVTVASRRMTDLLRREQARRRREDAVATRILPGERVAPAADVPAEDADDTLILIFMCCHPALTEASQIALTLRALGGLTTAEVGRALLVPEETVTRQSPGRSRPSRTAEFRSGCPHRLSAPSVSRSSSASSTSSSTRAT